MKNAAILGMTMLLTQTAWASNGYKTIAKDFAKSAMKARLERVAVLPFDATDDSAKADGANISERLITQLVRTGKVQVVERGMLGKILSEHSLGRTGLLDPRTLKKLGRILSVDAIVTGSFVTLGSEVSVNARLIQVETGVIVAAREVSAERDWFGSSDNGAFSVGDPFSVPVPALTVPVPPLGGEDLRDSVADGGECDNAAGRVDALEASVLELKARYWASKLRDGDGLRSAKVNPGSTITDPDLKARFYRRLKQYYVAGAPALSASEVRTFVSADGQAYRLHEDCGI